MIRTAVIGIIAGVAAALFIGNVKARDLGQWEAGDPEVRAWYRSLMQPDNPSASCCGESDAYFADVKVRGGKTLAVINDSRPDEPRGRPHIPNGTEFEAPDQKLKWDAGNPTGNAVLFVSRGGLVFCFVQGSGI
jgi:hypothetical protein